MKLHIGAVPESKDFNMDGSWQPIVEPDPKAFFRAVFPVGVLSAAILVGLWFCLTPITWDYFRYWFLNEISLVRMVVLFIALIVVHELIHAAFHPGCGFSTKSILGLWPSKGAFYAHWDDEWSRNRAIACIISPFIVLSVVPFVLSSLPYTLVPWLNYNMMILFFFTSVMNGFFCCGDLMGARLFFIQIPHDGIVRNNGYYTYWKLQKKEVKRR